MKPTVLRARARRLLPAAAILLALVVAVVVAGAFLVDPADSAPDPVAYEDTIELGMSSETDELMRGETAVPRAQVFFSSFQYVVGYNGIAPLVDALDDDRSEVAFGYPTAVHVETFDGAEPGVTDDGLFAAEGTPAWTPAEEAVYVVGSEAGTPAGETAVPFAEEEAAEAFTAEHGGEVVPWLTLREREFDVDTAATVRSMAPDRWEEADDRVADARERADRPVSVVVGEDVDTIGEAVEEAPANTTVVVPEGTYEETIEINRSVTVAGENTTIQGDDEGSVITVRAPDVALSGLSVAGVGNQTRDEEAVQEPPDDGDEGEAAWDTNVQLGYGHGDAGVRALSAPGLVVEDVHIETDASGVILREGSDATLIDLSVQGPDHWQDGFMGVVAMESRATVDGGEFDGGRDGIYAHRADGSVIRNATFEGTRYGVHLMYSGDALIADNVVRNAEYGGITVMTRPEGNAIVGNDVRDSPAGIQASGTRTYLGYNTLVNNRLGFSTSSRGSLYEHNVVVGNEQGARATTVIPSSVVTANDFLDNDRHAGAGAGPLRIWADGEVGNYWEGADAPLHSADRGYEATSPVDAAFHREPAASTIAESPAARLLDQLRGTNPGARTGGVYDPTPAAEPFDPDRVAAVSEDSEGPAHADWRDRIGANAEPIDAGNASIEPNGGVIG